MEMNIPVSENFWKLGRLCWNDHPLDDVGRVRQDTPKAENYSGFTSHDRTNDQCKWCVFVSTTTLFIQYTNYNDVLQIRPVGRRRNLGRMSGSLPGPQPGHSSPESDPTLSWNPASPRTCTSRYPHQRTGEPLKIVCWLIISQNTPSQFWGSSLSFLRFGNKKLGQQP